MPLLDHFRPPLHPTRHWESFHTAWAGSIADTLNAQLPAFFAEEQVPVGPRVEIDVGAFEDANPRPGRSGPTTATAAVVRWEPAAPTQSIPVAFPDSFEVRVFVAEGGTRLGAVIELVSPTNKDREIHRRALSAKCASYLAQAVSLITVDVVTSRTGDLHGDVLRLIGATGPQAEDGASLFAASYRPIVRAGREECDVWNERLRVGGSLPTLPLWLDAGTALPLDLDMCYESARARRRLT